MEARVTLVSGLFYISRDKWKYSGFPPDYDRYKGWIQNILSLDTNLILFTDDYYYDYVVETSKQYSPNLENISIIKKPLNELETFQNYYRMISCVMKSPEFKHYATINPVAEMCYPLYNVIMFDKVNLIKQAKELNPFQSNYFYWTDAGAFRDDNILYKDKKWPDVDNNVYFNDKITFFSHKGTNYSIDNQKDYFTSQGRVVHGGYFIVPFNQVDFLKDEFDKVVNEILDEGYVGSDEKLFDLICKRHPNQVSMIQSNWFEFYPMCSYKSKVEQNEKITKLVVITWNKSDTNDSFKQSNIYKSFKHFNPDKEVVNIHFNKNNYKELEEEYKIKYNNQSEFVLYRIYLALDKLKEIEADYIILADIDDTICLSKTDHLLDVFDLDNHIIYGMEKNDWPKSHIRESWEGYVGYDEYDVKNVYFLNASSVIAKKEKYIELLQTVINNILPLELKDVCDQGVFTYHYNKKIEPSIKLDTSSAFVVNTYDRSPDEYYVHNNKLYSKHNGVTPCFVHDNGWQWGSPQYRRIFNLDQLYL